MAEGRRGLGRGLSALLEEVEETPVQTGGGAQPAGEGVREIPIELIHRNPEQPRQLFAEQELAELEASIRRQGVLQPILVRPSRTTAGEFEIVAGERRWRAAQRAGLGAVPALVRELEDNQAFEIAVIENVQREDLNVLEEARAYASLMRRMQYTQDQTATALGKSRSHVANTLRLLALPEAVQEHVLAGRLSAGHARAILTSENPTELAQIVLTKGLSVRETEALARTKEGAKKTSGPRRTKDADTHALEADLEDVLGMSVEISDRGGAGELKIRYSSLEQLDEICRRLTRVG